MAIPQDYVPKTPPKKEFDLLPEDTYETEITNLELRKDQPTFNDPTVLEDRYNFEFTITEEGDFKGRKMWKEMRPILSAGGGNISPSWLYKVFCAVNQIKLSDEEAKMILVDKVNELEGKKIRIVVIQKPNKKGELKNKIGNFLPSKLVKISDQPMPEDDDTFQIDKGDLPF